MRISGGEREVGERHEETEANLQRSWLGAEAVCGGSPTAVGGGGCATSARGRRRGLADEVQGGEGNPFRGSIGAEEGRDSGSAELRWRPAMVATNVASLMVLGDGGWVGEDQREVEKVAVSSNQGGEG